MITMIYRAKIEHAEALPIGQTEIGITAFAAEPTQVSPEAVMLTIAAGTTSFRLQINPDAAATLSGCLRVAVEALREAAAAQQRVAP